VRAIDFDLPLLILLQPPLLLVMQMVFERYVPFLHHEAGLNVSVVQPTSHYLVS
jgi:hypothetical protein